MLADELPPPAVRYLAGDCGVRQFVDVGSGLPTRENTHEVAQQARPDARVAYVDNDPVVMAHADAILATDVTHGKLAERGFHDSLPSRSAARARRTSTQPASAAMDCS